MTDDELIESFLKGNEQGFHGLMDKYNGRVFNTIYGLVGHYHDAIDLTQDVFFQVYRNISGYKAEGHFSCWLFKIALNKSKNYIAKRKIITFFSLDWITKTSQASLIDHTESGNVEGYTDSMERAELFYEALNGLDYKFREILTLKEIDRLEYKEIATVLGIEIGTVKSRISRAKEKLKEQLQIKGIHQWL